VPKDAATMTGAALIPGQTSGSGGRPGTPSVGMTRYNSSVNPSLGVMEYFNGAWTQLFTLGQGQAIQGSVFGAQNPTTMATGIPGSPAQATLLTVAIPAGFTSFMIVGTSSFLFLDNTSGNPVNPQLAVNFDGTEVGFASIAPGGSFNGQFFKMSASASASVVNGSGSAHTVTMTANVVNALQSVDALSGTLSVFCFGNPN
jgi:hypothetical protein